VLKINAQTAPVNDKTGTLLLTMLKPYHLFKYSRFGDLKVTRDLQVTSDLKVTSDDDFTIIAHRGASAYYPENTIISFEGAIRLNADMVELDVQLTADGEVVVFHDEEISRCTNGRGRIADHTLAKVKKLDAGGWFDEKFQSEKIPTLAEVLSVCKNKIAVNIEVKTEAVTSAISGGIEEKCLQIVDRIGMREHVIFSSFDPRAVQHLRQLDHQAPAAVLYEKKHYGSKLPSAIVASLDAAAFNCSQREISPKWLADLKRHGIPVNIYTVNDEKNMKRLLAMGVGGIFTNYPDILKSVLEDFRWKQRFSRNRL
jgi:glycerophosphoryl diester phosphodiesterase